MDLEVGKLYKLKMKDVFYKDDELVQGVMLYANTIVLVLENTKDRDWENYTKFLINNEIFCIKYTNNSGRDVDIKRGKLFEEIQYEN